MMHAKTDGAAWRPWNITRSARGKRRSTASTHPGSHSVRRHRWITTIAVDVVIVAFAVLTAVALGAWTYVISGVLMALLTVSTLWLSEADVRALRARARVHERNAARRRRELVVLHEHHERAVHLIEKADPRAAAELTAAYGLDMLRLQAMSGRLASDDQER